MVVFLARHSRLWIGDGPEDGGRGRMAQAAHFSYNFW